MTSRDKPTSRPQHERAATGSRTQADQSVVMGLNAAIVSVRNDKPQVLVVKHRNPSPYPDDAEYGLPFGPFSPTEHRTIEAGLRSWVEEQTHLQLGYVEQLYTFGDRGRQIEPQKTKRVVSIGYLALTGEADKSSAPDSTWRDWYGYFPWEDMRDDIPPIIDRTIRPALDRWAHSADNEPSRHARQDRIRLCFGFDGLAWDEENVLERYELLYEAGLVYEAVRDRNFETAPDLPLIGNAMRFDHRRILATAMGRLRGKLKYRPVVFEVMQPSFTLLELQRTVEAISGIRLHKQNFRRLVESSGLVEVTGKVSRKTGGRPAQQFRFRREVLRERPAPGVRVPSPRAARRADT